ncbi:PTS sugar transporter subunit IIA, partial [Streptococcus pneumoniae]|uniref:PTS sugar transporter subunit IIA n=1 Tax=Streptococcus pneumoniae TaxID=1313 RepID=UPI0012D75C48
LYYRERQGSIEVAKGVLLPHCEGNFQHHVLVITRLKSPIREWSKDIQCVDLIIGLAIAVSQDKSGIKTLMRRLADESFINQLKQLTKEELREIIYGNQRYS